MYALHAGCCFADSTYEVLYSGLQCLFPAKYELFDLLLEEGIVHERRRIVSTTGKGSFPILQFIIASVYLSSAGRILSVRALMFYTEYLPKDICHLLLSCLNSYSL